MSLRFIFCLLFFHSALSAQQPVMYFSDSSGTGIALAKDPVVVNHGGRYLLYYSRKIKNDKSDGMQGWEIGIAESRDLTNWKKVGEINPETDYERKGLCAPGAILRDGKVHLFYQTYGNGPKDAICHAVSSDGIQFERNPTNPIFRPTGNWNNGRAIDAEVYQYKNQYFLYFATRDPAGKIQQQGVATAPITTDFRKADWTQAVDSSILKPQLPWEGDCIEGASIILRNKRLHMFYAGNYNNMPQQIGIAVSKDGISWKRHSELPFLPNGQPGSWNSSESGHPCIFEDSDGRTYLFFQGNKDNGKTWYLSKKEIRWNKQGPFLAD